MIGWSCRSAVGVLDGVYLSGPPVQPISDPVEERRIHREAPVRSVAGSKACHVRRDGFASDLRIVRQEPPQDLLGCKQLRQRRDALGEQFSYRPVILHGAKRYARTVTSGTGSEADQPYAWSSAHAMEGEGAAQTAFLFRQDSGPPVDAKQRTLREATCSRTGSVTPLLR